MQRLLAAAELAPAGAGVPMGHVGADEAAVDDGPHPASEMRAGTNASAADSSSLIPLVTSPSQAESITQPT